MSGAHSVDAKYIYVSAHITGWRLIIIAYDCSLPVCDAGLDLVWFDDVTVVNQNSVASFVHEVPVWR
jgi:hypothetical protein